MSAMAWRAAALLSSVEALRLGIMVTSRWSAFERRQLLRHAVAKCKEGLQGEIELLFFMANPSEEHEAAAWQEESQYGDLVEVGGPDSDPPVMRDVTYVLDRPCARTYRLLHGSKWLAEHRPNHDYVMYLDDDSFLNLPRLMAHLERQNSDSLAMGFVMETELDWSQTHVCELCNPCEMCRKEESLKAFCAQFQNVSMGGCMMAIENCEIFDGANHTSSELPQCINQKLQEIRKVSRYFGAKAAPRWFLGMGWVFGRRIVRFLGRNAHRLKSKGAADVSLGFWLAPLEGVRFVSMNEGFFHDHPDARSTFSKACTDRSVLVHRMNTSRWSGFQPETCEMVC
ncbi:unnamed protein product [Durusdinium trenchii]|uniref:Hexosyltransferase n=3 Tax=Durusdinium trenchii TaxID=1381693 RepID=A0ABP0MW24_9DINO